MELYTSISGREPQSFLEIRGTWENIAGNPASPIVMVIATRVWVNRLYSKPFVLAQGPELP